MTEFLLHGIQFENIKLHYDNKNILPMIIQVISLRYCIISFKSMIKTEYERKFSKKMRQHNEKLIK